MSVTAHARLLLATSLTTSSARPSRPFDDMPAAPRVEGPAASDFASELKGPTDDGGVLHCLEVAHSSSRSGRQLRMMATIAFCSSRASFNIECARRAKVRSATTVLVVSVSQEACTRRFAAVLSIAASFWPRNLARIGSGAAMTRLKTCCWALVEALIAERRAAHSTDERASFTSGSPRLAQEQTS